LSISFKVITSVLFLQTYSIEHGGKYYWFLFYLMTLY